MNGKIIATAAVSFVVGSLVGWAYASDKAEEQRARDKRDLEAMSHLLSKRTRQLTEVSQELNNMHKVVVPEEVVDPETPIKQIEGETEEETRANLQEIIDIYKPDRGAQGNFVENGRKVVESTKFDPPFVVSRELVQWDPEEGDDYEKSTLSYYPIHRVLVDEMKDIVPNGDIDSMVGWKNLNRFGDESGDQNVVFVRNRRLEVDYEIVNMEDDELPTHIKYGMSEDEFKSNKAAGKIRLREGDE